MKKIIVILLLTFSLVLTACIQLEDIRPVDSRTSEPTDSSEPTSTDEQSEELSSSTFSEELYESSEIEPESSEVYEESSEDLSEEPSEESSEEMNVFEYNGFTVKGFSEYEVSALIDTLASTVKNAGANVSIYYEDINTGKTIMCNQDTKYCSGSVIKAPYCAHLIKYMNVNLDEKYAIQSWQKMTGSGVLQNEATGKEYTVDELIKYCMVYSDNTAYKMLYDAYGFDYFNQYAMTLGTDVSCDASAYLGYLGFMNVCDVASFLKDIYYSAQTDEDVARMMRYMTESEYKWLIVSGIKEKSVAHKYGYMNGAYKVLHDGGIVLDDDPYILIIMTDYNPAGGNGRSTFTKIASEIDGFAEN